MRIGDVINQRYTLTAQLGKGAMGLVYGATDKTTHLKVAVKVISQDLAVDHEMLERFRREGEALRRLRHQNIVAFVDMFERKGEHVIVMEYVPGGDLHALIRHGALDVWRATQIGLDLCDALASAHRLNIIHRDIKPENILLAEDGTPKLTDFGVARLVGAGTRLTGTGTQVGTPYYMSPEAWEGKALDAQADVWSLGVVLFEMLTGQVPFGGDTVVAVMNQVLTAPLPDLRQLRPDTPPELAQVVRRALTRDKAQRYTTIRQMGTDLEMVLLAAPAAAALPPTPQPAQTAPQSAPPPFIAPPPIRATPPLAAQPPAPQLPATLEDTHQTQAAPRAPGGRLRWAWVAGGLALAAVICLLGVGGGALAMKMLPQLAPGGQVTPTTSISPAAPLARATGTPPPNETLPAATKTPYPSNTPDLPTAIPNQPTADLSPTQAPAAAAKPVKKIAFFVSDLSNVFHQAQAAEAKKYAKERYGADVFVFDGKADSAVMTQNVDQIKAQGMDAATLHIWDYEAAKPTLLAALSKGVILTTFFSPLGDSGVPVARNDEKGISFAMGAEMAKQWKAAQPDKPIVMVELGWPNHTEVKSGRTDPWVQGVLSVDPSAKDLGCQDVSQGSDQARQVMTGLLRSHPEVNLIYSEASGQTVGTLAALAQAGRGKMLNGKPLTEIVCSTDFDVVQLNQVYDPNNSLKLSLGLPPIETADGRIDLIMDIASGKVKQTVQPAQEFFYKAYNLSYWTKPRADAVQWLNTEFGTNVK